jgi:hypothetical protein
MVDSVRNILFGAPGSGAGGQDLFALDIQRGRDVGLPTYNAARLAYGLSAVTSFDQITSDPTLKAELKQVYGTVDQVELFVGGLAEDHAPGSSMGPTFQAIIANQFERVRDGDRMWYQNIFSGASLRGIQNTSLADIIARDTNVTNLQSNVFVFDASIVGQVFLDANANGRPDKGDSAAGGILVQLLDTNGNVLASTHTRRDGTYQFESLDLAKYQVRIVPPAGMRPTTSDPASVSITRGGAMIMDFGIASKPRSSSTNAAGLA